MRQAPRLIRPLPQETARAARAVFGKGNLYRMIGDQYERLFSDLVSPGWMEPAKQTGIHPFTLLLITIFQMLEGLSDWRAVEALRTRLDWKYALHLPLDFPGFDRSALCELRRRLRWEPLALHHLVDVLEKMKKLNILPSKNFEQAEIDSALEAICTLTRLEEVHLAFSAALEILASERPDWLRKVARPHWYGQSHLSTSTSELPISRLAQYDLATTIGEDVDYLLEAIDRSGLSGMEFSTEIRTLRQVQKQQYELSNGQWKITMCARCYEEWLGSV